VSVSIRINKTFEPDELLEIIKKLRALISKSERKTSAFVNDSKLRHLHTLLQQLEHAYNEYEEEGEVDYIDENEYIIPAKDLYKLLSPKRLELLFTLAKEEYISISELSRVLKRNIKNIYTDLKFFEQYGLVKLVKRHKSVQPKLIAREIVIHLA